MRIRSLALGSLACLVGGAGLWFTTLDAETRGVILAHPTNRDVLMWSQSQREAAFRALDRLPILAKAARISPSPTPLALPR